MKQGQNARNPRARTASRKHGKATGNNRNDNNVRGNPKQHLEKYKNQAREAQQAGDRVNAELYLQYADHYQRLVNEKNAQQGNQQNTRSDGGDKVDAASGDNSQNNRDNNRRNNGRRNNNRNDNRRGGRNQNQDQAQNQDPEQPQDQASDSAPKATADMSEAPQPTEVRPELDLGDEKAPAPKRTRRPRKPKVEAETAPADAGPADTGTAEAVAATAEPTDGEAA